VIFNSYFFAEEITNMNVKFLLVPGLFLILSCSLPAASITGSFSIDGSVTVTGNTISWTDNSSVADMYVVGPPTPTGTWATMPLNSEGTVQPLNLTSEPVGGTFPAFNFPNWMTFPGPGPQSTITITLQYIYQGFEGQASCGASPAPGQVCTPLDAAGTPGPFNLQNSASGTTSSATWTFLGTAVDSSGKLSPTEVIGQYSANFNEPYQQVLQQLATTGFVTNTYAATWTAQASTVPEPDTLQLFGIGLGLCTVAVIFRRLKPSRS
jgi:hypothetical protein